MAAMSDYLENLLINHIFRSSSFTKPSTLAVALLTTAAADSDTGQFSTGTGVEVVNDFAYARQVLNPSDSNWKDPSTPTQGDTSNLATITFPVALGGTWGTIVAVAVTDSATYDSGNMLLHASLNDSVTINNGDTFIISSNDLTINFD